MTFTRFLRTRSFETYKPALGFSLASLTFATSGLISQFGLKLNLLALCFYLSSALCTNWLATEGFHIWNLYKEEKDLEENER